MLRSILAAAVLMLSAGPGSAATLERMAPAANGYEMIFLKGEIEEGDSERFHQVAEQVRHASVVLESPGGLVKEGLSIAAEIAHRGFATMVLPDQECASIGGIIWLAGNHRYMHAQSKIGFHAAYLERADGTVSEKGSANADIGAFLAMAGVPRKVILFVTEAPPEGIRWMSLHEARALGIPVYENVGTDVVTPEMHPTMPQLARYGVFALIMGEACPRNLPFEAPRTAALRDRIYADGKAEYGDAVMEETAGILVDEVDRVKLDGQIAWCKKAYEATFGTDIFKTVYNAEGVGDPMPPQPSTSPSPSSPLMTSFQPSSTPTAPSASARPSFDCAKASTAAEHAICGSENLASADRMIATEFRAGLKRRSGADKKAWLGRQREFLKEREACGGNVGCLIDVMLARARELQAG